MYWYRPKSLNEFIGQERIKKELKVYLDSIKKREDVFPHTFLVGAPGLGKTTIAKIIAFELRRDFKITSGPVLDKIGTIAGILTSLKEGDILFIDEIHRMPKQCQEVLYTAMEDFALDIVIGKGNSSKTIRLSLPKFTLIGATNKPNLCLPPLLDRLDPSLQQTQSIIMTPTRELAMQVQESVELYGKHLPYKSTVVFAKISNAQYYYEVHDLWPLSPMELGGMSASHPFIKIMLQKTIMVILKCGMPYNYQTD